MTMAKKSYHIDEVAEAYEVSRKTVEREIKRGELEAIRIGRALRIKAEALTAYELKKKVVPNGLR